MPRTLVWLLAGLLTIFLTILAFLPASWMAPIVEAQSGGRLTLGDPQGSLWQGSAFVGAAPGPREPVTPLLPGRFAWTLSPLVLVGQVKAEVSNPSALSQPVQIQGSWRRWQVSASSVNLPAERLTALGAPLNTIQPSGAMRLSWNPLQLVRSGQDLAIMGSMTLALEDIASRLSPVKPLGAYKVTLDWRGQQADMQLETTKGPMLLSGSGKLVNGRLAFSGKAEAEAGQEERLANLLNLLGQRRSEGDKDVIALEFR